MGIKRTVSIRRIDLWGIKPLESKKMKQKMQKTEMSIFPMYFWANSFVKKKAILNTLPVWILNFCFFSGVHIGTCAQKSGLALFECWKKCISLHLNVYRASNRPLSKNCVDTLEKIGRKILKNWMKNLEKLEEKSWKIGSSVFKRKLEGNFKIF